VAISSEQASNDTMTQAPPAGPSRDGATDLVANSLWKILNLARANSPMPRTLTDDEDAVFRFYLPFAHALAAGHPTATTHPAAAQEAAEVGLAQAVLAWRYRDSHDFQRFAGIRIQAQFRASANRRTQSANTATLRP
jgi:hypothetical protein